jgi:hypothetical protein
VLIVRMRSHRQVFNSAVQPMVNRHSKSPMPNQYKPTRMHLFLFNVSKLTIGLAPLDEIAPHILRLWKARQNDRQIVRTLREKHIDTERYGIGYVLQCFMTCSLSPFNLYL